MKPAILTLKSICWAALAVGLAGLSIYIMYLTHKAMVYIMAVFN